MQTARGRPILVTSSPLPSGRRHTLQRCFVWLTFLFTLGCGVPERPKVVKLEDLPTFRPSSPRDIKTAEQALAAVITVCRDDLKLPVVKSFQAKFYKNSQSFATYGVDWRAFPIDVEHAAAFARESDIHIDLQKVDKQSGWAIFTWLLAHEYGHTVHHQVAGVIPATDPWVTEGFAEWVAAKVFDALGWQPYGHAVHRSATEAAKRLDILPPLTELRHYQAWQRRLTRYYGHIQTYSLALVAVDRLIRRKQLGSAVPLLSASGFNEAMGGPYDEFDRELRTYLSTYRKTLSTFDPVNSPQWKIGDKWKYERRRAGDTIVTERQFDRQGIYAGIPSHVLRSGSEESYYAMESLSLVKRQDKEKLIYRVFNLDRVIAWPLQLNKQWRNSFTREDLEVGDKRSVELIMMVAGAEISEVKAGKFRTIRIEAYGYRSGRLLAEFWYSPKAKWFAKSQVYHRDYSLVEEELVSFNVQ